MAITKTSDAGHGALERPACRRAVRAFAFKAQQAQIALLNAVCTSAGHDPDLGVISCLGAWDSFILGLELSLENFVKVATSEGILANNHGNL